VRDFASAENQKLVTQEIADFSLGRLEIDEIGLDASDRRYLKFIAENYRGGPVGIDTIASALSEERDSVEDTIEPFLIQKGFVEKTPRGRVLTEIAFKHLGIEF
jgi:Holliday junction DNA helicase RuvB